MNNEFDNTKHPSALTDQQKAEIAASIDEDPADDGAVAAKADTDELPADEVTKDDAEPPKADDAPTGKGPMIPKARFDEVNNELKEIRGKVEALEAQRTAALAPLGDARDFAAEVAELEAKYDNGDIDLAEYLRENRKLTVEEAKFAARAEQAMVQAEANKQAAQTAWTERITAWETNNAEFLSNSVRRDTVARLFETLGKDAALTDAQLIAKVEAEAFEAFNYAPKAASTAATSRNPHGTRNAADAAAQAAASSAPSPAAGGMGDRGRDVGIDILKMKPGQFNKLTKEQQAAILGEDVD